MFFKDEYFRKVDNSYIEGREVVFIENHAFYDIDLVLSLFELFNLSCLSPYLASRIQDIKNYFIELQASVSFDGVTPVIAYVREGGCDL